MRMGSYAHLESVRPPATLPNWTTFLTGVNPGVHGVFDFTVRDGYSVRFKGGTLRVCPTLFEHLDRLGLSCASVGFPATWPPPRLRHGVFISGWDAPVAFESDSSFIWPRALHDAIVERFGPIRCDDVNEFAAERTGWHEELAGALVRRIGHKTALAKWLLGTRQ